MRFPDPERPYVVVICGKPVEGEVEDRVSRVQHEMRRLEQRRIASDERHGAWSEVVLEPPGRVRPDVEGAVDHRPRTPRCDGVEDLDAEQRRHDDLGLGISCHLGDRAGRLLRPFVHALLHDRPCCGRIAAG